MGLVIVKVTARRESAESEDWEESKPIVKQYVIVTQNVHQEKVFTRVHTTMLKAGHLVRQCRKRAV